MYRLNAYMTNINQYTYTGKPKTVVAANLTASTASRKHPHLNDSLS